MPNIPSPISETSEDSYFPPPIPSARHSHPPGRSAPPNFSRPRPTHADATSKLHRDAGEREHHISAFYEDPTDELPDEPRFSLDSARTASTSDRSAASEFAWDGEAGELRSRRRPRKFDEQRVSLESPRRGTGAGSSGSSSGAASRRQHRQQPHPPHPPAAAREPRTPSSSSSTTSSSKSSHPRADPQQSPSRPSTSTRDSARSNHTTTSSSSGGSLDAAGRWQSSAHDCSGLDEAELQRLRKKGVNPALYAEMRAARKGRSRWVGALSGNTFLS